MDPLFKRINHIYKKYGYHWLQESFTITEQQKESLKQFKETDSLFIYRGKEIDKDHQIISQETYNQLYDMIKQIRNASEYESYISNLHEFLDIIGLRKDGVVESGTMSLLHRKSNYLIVRIKRPETDTIHISAGNKLYHTSTIANLTELRPTFKAGDPEDRFDIAQEALYPSQRVYFYTSIPGSRFGSNIVSDENHIYAYTVPYDMDVKQDTELATHGDSIPIFIETKTPLPVTEVKRNE